MAIWDLQRKITKLRERISLAHMDDMYSNTTSRILLRRMEEKFAMLCGNFQKAGLAGDCFLSDEAFALSVAVFGGVTVETADFKIIIRNTNEDFVPPSIFIIGNGTFSFGQKAEFLIDLYDSSGDLLATNVTAQIWGPADSAVCDTASLQFDQFVISKRNFVIEDSLCKFLAEKWNEYFDIRPFLTSNRLHLIEERRNSAHMQSFTKNN